MSFVMMLILAVDLIREKVFFSRNAHMAFMFILVITFPMPVVKAAGEKLTTDR
jgi:hypothetical protein